MNRNPRATKGCELYIVRVSPTGLGASKPCESCLTTLREFGIEKIYYSTREGIVMEEIQDVQPYVRSYGDWLFKERSLL